MLKADAGMTGCNFAVAETGTFVVCTNEGNADLSANVPKLHIASIGIEKIIGSLIRLPAAGTYAGLLGSRVNLPYRAVSKHLGAMGE
jgi:L-lactate utilization protein LutB